MSQQIPDLDVAPSVDKDDDYFLIYRAATGTLERVTADQIMSDVPLREIARTTLGAEADTITVNGIPARTNLLFVFRGQASGGTLDTSLRFNNDSGSTYNFTHVASYADAAPTASASQTSIPFESGATDSAQALSGELSVLFNKATAEKSFRWSSISQDAAGAATQAAELQGFGKWANTSTQITRIDWINAGTGNFAVGSEVVVYGSN